MFKLLITLTIAQNIIYYGILRFSAPIEPMLILLDAGFIWWLTYKENGTTRWIIDSMRGKDQASIDTSDQSESTLVLNKERIHNAPSQA